MLRVQTFQNQQGAFLADRMFNIEARLGAKYVELGAAMPNP